MATPKAEKLSIKHELFCQHYVKNRELFGNATQSYAEAYGFNLHELDTERVYDESGKMIESSERDKAELVCAVQGNRLLRMRKIQERNTELLNELLRDDIVDGELASIIMQNYKLEPKIGAIREYNRLRQRIVEKTDLTSGGKPIVLIDTATASKYGITPSPTPDSE